ncbi:MAG: radical SAM family heme chaperone HemW [Pseudomonadota bacterium]
MDAGDQTAPLTRAPAGLQAGGRACAEAGPGPVVGGSAQPRPDWAHGGFGVYIHWPFCQAKCPYCDFNSHVQRTVDHGAWRAALLAELGHMRALSGPRRAQTVFFGGGTPSLMEPATVAALIEAVDQAWGLDPDAEITLEANPTSVEAARLQGFRAAGVNRVSMGIQALNDKDLRALGRMHSTSEALAAFDIARATFDRVSFDLIYARMGQSPDAWEAELRRALGLAADHLSLYQLTIEDGTRFGDMFARGRLTIPPDGHAADMYALTQEMAAAAGLPAYEVSNHAAPGAESRHNLIYWRMGDYAGIGPGAHGRITGPDGITRATETVRDPARWLNAAQSDGHGLAAAEPVPADERATEYLMMALRLAEGADPARYQALAGAPLDPARLADLEASGHVVTEGGRIAATSQGRMVLNAVLHHLLV